MRRMTGRLGFYVMLRAAVGVAAMLATVAAVVLLTLIVEIARDLGSRAEVDFLDIVQLALMRTPFIVVQFWRSSSCSGPWPDSWFSTAEAS